MTYADGLAVGVWQHVSLMEDEPGGRYAYGQVVGLTYAYSQTVGVPLHVST
jgi:hypothetical protein